MEIDIRTYGEGHTDTIRFDDDAGTCGCVISPTTDYKHVVISSKQDDNGESRHEVYISMYSIDNLIKALKKAKELWGQ